ncbi:hypothetical protein KC218_27915, partial [Mycobacterium tuberculosis]|nr:hypothetical protein [Mycobacterium tuberculosis]
LSPDAGFQPVSARHERGPGSLAAGPARASGQSAAVSVAGPGATNVTSAVHLLGDVQVYPYVYIKALFDGMVINFLMFTS